MDDSYSIILNLSKKKINIIPSEIQYLTNLQKLDLNYNYINIIPSEIQYLTNLQELYLSYNNLIIISSKIQYLTNLQKLKLSDNSINIIPSEIQYLTNLQNLDLCKNNIKIIPNEIQYLTNLQELYLDSNNINIITNEIQYLTNLEILELTKNQINNIPSEIQYLTNLEKIYLRENNINSIPIAIIRCTNLKSFYFDNNEIEYIPPQVIRFLNRIKNIDKLQVYNDSQNIHNHSIQESLNNSINNIMQQEFIINEEIIMNEILNDTILTDKCKELLFEYSSNLDFHSVLLLNFKELLCHCWITINNLETKDEIKKILNIEMLDSECKCFTGRITRLVNCLNGLSDLVKINISDNQQIGNIIIIIKEQLRDIYTIEKHKELVKNELQERGYNENIINEWLDYIE